MKKSYRHHVIFNEEEEQMKNEMMKAQGFRFQELMRYLLKFSYQKHFPPYVQLAKEAEESKDLFKRLTNEKYCEDVLGGTVQGAMCVVERENGSVTEIPLNIVKEEQRSIN